MSYIVFLHQTTTDNPDTFFTLKLSYIVFLHQTTTEYTSQMTDKYCLISSFYIKPQLQDWILLLPWDCLISSFYIKPQPSSTENVRVFVLSYIVFLHQTTTVIPFALSTRSLSYIVFLHQTTTLLIYSSDYQLVLSYLKQ